MSLCYRGAKLGQECEDCNSIVRVISAKKFSKGHPTAGIEVGCDCGNGFYRLTKAEREMLPAMLGVGRA